MEIVAVVDVFSLCWVNVLHQVSEFMFAEFMGSLRGESVFDCMLKSFLVFTVDGSSCCFGKALSVQVLTGYLRNISCVPWNVLSLNILCWTSNPIFSVTRLISILDSIKIFILWRWVNVIVGLFIKWFANSNVNVVL